MTSGFVQDLRDSIRECSSRGLLSATKWSSELLLSIPISKRRQPKPQIFSTSTPVRTRSRSFVNQSPSLPPSQTPNRHPHAPPLLPQITPVGLLDPFHDDSLASARICFQSKEYSRVPVLLAKCTNPIARFMSLYSRFLALESRGSSANDLEWHKYQHTNNNIESANDEIHQLLKEIRNETTDPWILFLKAIFLSRLSRREEAIESAILSIAGFPWNWSTWVLLGSCIRDGEELTSLLPLLPLPQTHPLAQLFQISTLNALQIPTENEIALCDRLLSDEGHFPSSIYIMSLRFIALYHLHDFTLSEIQFDKILELDPYRVEDLDIYSNVLYVCDKRSKLGRLAEGFLGLGEGGGAGGEGGKEVCCLIGNHYSLRAEHLKAIKYFQRATQLDRTYLSAWTLMGHEYVEVKNSHAAIDAYRRAVDVNRKDYRAWYGLGQAYELLNMHEYALHYYQYATALRPYDVRLWQAQGMCYEEMGKLRESIECLKRALIPADPHEITINLMLARIHRELDERAEAVAYHRRVVEVCLADGRPVHDYAKSSLEVASYQLQLFASSSASISQPKPKQSVSVSSTSGSGPTKTPAHGGDLLLAQEYLERVAASNAEEVGKATEMLKEVYGVLRLLREKEREEREAEADAGNNEKGPVGVVGNDKREGGEEGDRAV